MQNQAEDHLPKYRVRPRFQIETNYTIEELAQKIHLGLKQADSTCEGRVIPPNHATLYLPYEEQHYWSPQLSLTFNEGESGSTLRGLYGPRPAVWTMFVFFYCIVGFAILIISLVGLSYLNLNLPAPILWWLPVLVLVFCSLYLVAYFGQKKGRDQMIILHQFLEKSLNFDIVDQE